MLRDLATVWVRKNCPHPQLQRDFMHRLQLAEQQERDCSFLIGPTNTKNHKPYLVHSYAGELFVFGLTPKQGRSLGAIGTKMQSRLTGPTRQVAPTADASITLERMEIDGEGQVKVTEPIRGRCHYRMTGYFFDPWCMCLEYELHQRAHVIGWCMPLDRLRPEGTIEFFFAAIENTKLAHQAPWRGTTAVFLRFLTMPHPSIIEDRVPISNAAGASIDVV